MSIEISGMDELSESLKRAIDIYPDCAEEMLVEQMKVFRAKVKERYWQVVKAKRTGKLTKGFRISKIRNFRENMEIDFMAESKVNPHFHLVENGHNLVKRNGESYGRIDGYHVVEKTRSDFGIVMVLATKQMVDDILEGSGLD
ncbi:MAG: hypothetical protein ACI4GD_00595 [Lachnospiraceae bacterium]